MSFVELEQPVDLVSSLSAPPQPPLGVSRYHSTGSAVRRPKPTGAWTRRKDGSPGLSLIKAGDTTF